MANALVSTGVVTWFAGMMKSQVAGLTGVWLVVVLGLIYFFSMYGFSMFTAHISALIAAFFAVVAGFPPLASPMLMIAVMAYFSCLCGAMTNYSTGPVIIYYGLGYVTTGKWFKTGLVVAFFHLAIWLTVGLAWWKLLGWW